MNLKKALFDCLKEGGRILEKGFGSTFAVHNKGPVDLVTEVDLAIDKKVIAMIRKSFPDHRILTEESLPRQGSSPYRWIIDPLDGTSNFAHGIPICCVSIGLEHNGKMILGGVYCPMLRELFFAEAGKGAFLNGRRIRVSGVSRLIESMTVTGFPYDRQKRADFYLRYVRAMLLHTQGLRRLGAAALDLAYLACGRFDIYWEFNLKPWDAAAGILLVQEAGGKVTDLANKPVKIDRPVELICTNKTLHKTVISLLKKVPNHP